MRTINRRGDRRGMNGVRAQRDSHGRFFVRSTPAHLKPQSIEALNETLLLSTSMSDHHETAISREGSIFDGAFSDDGSGIAEEHIIFDGASTGAIPDGASTDGISFTQVSSTIVHPVAPLTAKATAPFSVVQVFGTLSVSSLATRAATGEGIGPDFDGLDYASLMHDSVVTALKNNSCVLAKGPPKKRALYATWLLKQAHIDRRDSGILPYVVKIDDSFPTLKSLRVCDGDVVIMSIDTNDCKMLMAVAKIFKDRTIMAGTPPELLHDMKIFSSGHFRMVGGWRDGVLVGAVVFRSFILNTSDRMLHIELIATKFSTGPGVGSAMMRLLRKLSHISVLQPGHIAAFTLKTKEAKRFYDRKLPECNGPNARSLMISMLCIDNGCKLYPHLDMRCVTVFPEA